LTNVVRWGSHLIALRRIRPLAVCAALSHAGKRAAFSPRDANLTPGKNAGAAEGSQRQKPELAKEHSGGGQRRGNSGDRSMSHSAASPLPTLLPLLSKVISHPNFRQ